MTEPTTTADSHKLRKGVVLTALLVLAFIAIIALGVSKLIQDDPASSSNYNKETDSGTTESTGAPTTPTNTPADRSQPSPSGGEANTILQPPQ